MKFGIRNAALILAAITLLCFVLPPAIAQDESHTTLPSSETMLLTVFLKHDQSMNNVQRRDVLNASGFRDMFPPDGVEVVDHYVMMGIGQVIVLKFAPNQLRTVNRAIEHGAWGAFQTEFYVTYDLREARAAEQSSRNTESK